MQWLCFASLCSRTHLHANFFLVRISTLAILTQIVGWVLEIQLCMDCGFNWRINNMKRTSGECIYKRMCTWVNNMCMIVTHNLLIYFWKKNLSQDTCCINRWNKDKDDSEVKNINICMPVPVFVLMYLFRRSRNYTTIIFRFFLAAGCL